MPVLGALPRRPLGLPPFGDNSPLPLLGPRRRGHLGYALQNVSGWLCAESALRQQVSGLCPTAALQPTLPFCHYSSITASRLDGCFSISCADCMPKTLLGGGMLEGSAPAAFFPAGVVGANVLVSPSRLRHCRRGCMAGAICAPTSPRCRCSRMPLRHRFAAYPQRCRPYPVQRPGQRSENAIVC